MSIESASEICSVIDPQIDEVRHQLVDTERAIQRLAGSVFKDRNVARSLVEASGSALLLNKTVEALHDNPAKLGSLKREGYMKPVIEGTEKRAKELAVELERRVDLKQTLKQYDNLAHRATHVSVMSKKDQEKEIVELRTMHKDCEQDRATRDQRYKQKREPFGGGTPGGDLPDERKGTKQRSILSAAADAVKSRLTKDRTKFPAKSPFGP